MLHLSLSGPGGVAVTLALAHIALRGGLEMWAAGVCSGLRRAGEARAPFVIGRAGAIAA